MTSQLYARSGRNVVDGQFNNIYCNSISTGLLQNLVQNNPTAATSNTVILNNSLANSPVTTLPVGNFYINGPLNITNNYTKLNGAGRGISTLSLIATGSVNAININSNITGTVLSGIQITNLSINGLNTLGVGSLASNIGVYVYGAYGALIENVEVDNLNGSSFKFDGQTNQQSSICWLKNCISSYPIGSHVIHASGSQDCQISECFNEFAGGVGVELDAFGSKMFHSHSYRNLNQNVQIGSFGGRNEISNCILDSGFNWGLVVNGSKQNLIKGNIFFSENLAGQGAGGISVITGSDGLGANNIITNNIFYDDGASVTSFSGTNGLYYTGRSATTSTMIGVSVSTGCLGNVITDNQISLQIPTRIQMLQSTQNLVQDTAPLGYFFNQTQGVLRSAQGLSTNNSVAGIGFNAVASGSNFYAINPTTDFSAFMNFSSSGSIQLSTVSAPTGAVNNFSGTQITLNPVLTLDSAGVVTTNGGQRNSILVTPGNITLPLNVSTVVITGSSAGNFLTLPLASTCPGQEYKILKLDTGTMNLSATGANLVQSALSIGASVSIFAGTGAMWCSNDGLGRWFLK